jgi:4-amino-4-deoxy-L-arabinose transferase-like glycosyltransferase
VRVLPLLSLVLGLAGAGILAGARWIPYEALRQWLDRFAADGTADAYTAAIHAGIVGRLRYVGLGLVLLGILLYLVRSRLPAAGRALAASAVRLWRDVARAVREAWADAPIGQRVAFVGILAAGIGVRLWHLEGPMRYDEAFTFLNYAREPLILGLTRYDMPNNHLFHTALVHGAYRLLGDAPWALRVPALLAGILVMPATALAVRTLYGRHAALLATALVATSMATIGTSTNARGYSLVTLLFLALVALGAYLRRTDRGAGWVLFAGLGALALYTVPTAIYAIATVSVWLVLEVWAGDLRVPARRFVLRLAGAVVATGLLTALLYAPVLIRTDPATLLATSPVVALKVTPMSFDAFLAGNATRTAEVWRRWASDLTTWLQALWLVGIAAALVWHRRLGRTRVPLVAGSLLGGIPILVVQRVVPPSRIWIFLLPVFAGMGAAGVLHLAGWLLPPGRRARARRPLAVGLALLLTAGGVLTLAGRARDYGPDQPEFPGAEQAVTFVKPQLVSGDKVLVYGMSQTPFLFYARRAGLPHLTYLYDYVLEGWAPLRDAKRVFVVMVDPRYSLADVLATAQVGDAAPPSEVARFDAGRVYLLQRP